MDNDKLIEAMARAIEASMGPLVGSPEYLADPVKLARAQKRRRDGAIGYATAALNALRDTLEPVHRRRNPRREGEAMKPEPTCPFTGNPAWQCLATCTCEHWKPRAEKEKPQ